MPTGTALDGEEIGIEIQVTTIRPIGQKSCDRKRIEDLIAIWVKRDNRSQYHFGATGRKISTFFFCSWFFFTRMENAMPCWVSNQNEQAK
jgi:hypothetical protein